nr:hypothetical protein [Bifidobacterium moukalabense]
MAVWLGEHSLVLFRHILKKSLDSFRNRSVSDASIGKLIGFRGFQIRFLKQRSRSSECFLASGEELGRFAEVFGLDVFDESVRNGFLGIGDTQLDWHVRLLLTLIPQDSSISTAVSNSSLRIIRMVSSSGAFSGQVMKSSHLDISVGSMPKGVLILVWDSPSGSSSAQ